MRDIAFLTLASSNRGARPLANICRPFRAWGFVFVYLLSTYITNRGAVPLAIVCRPFRAWGFVFVL